MNDIEKYFTPLAIKIMQENDMTLTKLGSRLQNFEKLDDVFTYKNRGRKTIYPPWAALKCKENKISRQTLHHRMHRLGWTLEDAVNKPIRRISTK